MAKRRQFQVVSLIAGLVVILRSPTLFESMYLVDEGYSGAVASELLYGGTLYQTAVDTRAPFIYYVYYGVFRLAGQNNLFAVHILAILVVFATALTVGAIGAQVAGARAGVWAATGYVIFSHTYLPRDTLAANVEIFTLLPLTLSWWCFLRGERRVRPFWLTLSGVFCGVSLFFRQTCLFNIGVMLAYLAYTWRIAGTKTRREAVQAGAFSMAGWIATVGLIAAYFYARGNWGDMIEWTWRIAMHYVDSETTVAYVIQRLFLVHLTFIVAGGLLWYFGGLETVRVVRAHVRRHITAPETMLIVLWLASSYTTLFAGWRFPGHYHLMVLPPLAILAGTAFTRYLERLRTQPPAKIRRVRRWLAAAAGVPAIGFLIMAFDIREQTIAFKPITRYVAAHTRPEDRIFVWGSAPHIYSFSGRRMATRFVSCTHLVGMYASRPHKDIDESRWVVSGSWTWLEQDLTANPPELIVDMSPVSPNWDAHPMSRYAFWRRYLAHYRLEETVSGAHIYRRTPQQTDSA